MAYLIVLSEYHENGIPLCTFENKDKVLEFLNSIFVTKDASIEKGYADYLTIWFKDSETELTLPFEMIAYYDFGKEEFRRGVKASYQKIEFSEL